MYEKKNNECSGFELGRTQLTKTKKYTRFIVMYVYCVLLHL